MTELQHDVSNSPPSDRKSKYHPSKGDHSHRSGIISPPATNQNGGIDQ